MSAEVTFVRSIDEYGRYSYVATNVKYPRKVGVGRSVNEAFDKLSVAIYGKDKKDSRHDR